MTRCRACDKWCDPCPHGFCADCRYNVPCEGCDYIEKYGQPLSSTFLEDEEGAS